MSKIFSIFFLLLFLGREMGVGGVGLREAEKSYLFGGRTTKAFSLTFIYFLVDQKNNLTKNTSAFKKRKKRPLREELFLRLP